MRNKTQTKTLVLSVALTSGVVFVVTTPLSWSCLYTDIVVAHSHRGYAVLLIKETGPRGDAKTTAFFENQGQLRKIGELGSGDDGPDVRAFWSKDGTLFGVQDSGGSVSTFDCAHNIFYDGPSAGRRLLRQKGGAGKLIFSGVSDFNDQSHHPWWWELQRIESATR